MCREILYGLISFFFSLANRNDNACLTSDCRGINPKSRDKIRTRADNTVVEQRCYFNIRANDRLYNTFIRKGIRNSASDINSIQFQSKRLTGRSKSSEAYNTTLELRKL